MDRWYVFTTIGLLLLVLSQFILIKEIRELAIFKRNMSAIISTTELHGGIGSTYFTTCETDNVYTIKLKGKITK